MTNYLYSNGNTTIINTGNFTIYIDQISTSIVFKITKNASCVCLGCESAWKFCELLSLLKFRTSILKQLPFI